MSAHFNYARAKKTADRLIKKFGKTTASVLIEPGEMTGPAWNPTQADPINHPCDAVVLDYSERQIDGDRIRTGDRRVLIAVGAQTKNPTPSWVLQIQMKGDAQPTKYKIIQVKPLEPGDLTILWDVQCRVN
jgi:hypothetical protein